MRPVKGSRPRKVCGHSRCAARTMYWMEVKSAHSSAVPASSSSVTIGFAHTEQAAQRIL